VTVMENRIIVAPSGTGWQGTSTTFNIQHSTFNIQHSSLGRSGEPCRNSTCERCNML
jgi:hypothetical protein